MRNSIETSNADFHWPLARLKFFTPWMCVSVANVWKTPRASLTIANVAEACSSHLSVRRREWSPSTELNGLYRPQHLLAARRRCAGLSSLVGGFTDINPPAIATIRR